MLAQARHSRGFSSDSSWTPQQAHPRTSISSLARHVCSHLPQENVASGADGSAVAALCPPAGSALIGVTLGSAFIGGVATEARFASCRRFRAAEAHTLRSITHHQQCHHSQTLPTDCQILQSDHGQDGSSDHDPNEALREPPSSWGHPEAREQKRDRQRPGLRPDSARAATKIARPRKTAASILATVALSRMLAASWPMTRPPGAGHEHNAAGIGKVLGPGLAA